jgi:CTP synthase (UTP-ammonia lyase)
MEVELKIGVIGDLDPSLAFHKATNEAIFHAGEALGLKVSVSWISTPTLNQKPAHEILSTFDAIWCSPGSPYQSMEGALEGIRVARENSWPFFATWGGFQHALIEYARNVLGIPDADHEESSPEGKNLLINRLECSLAGRTCKVVLVPESNSAKAYGRNDASEQFHCNFGLNPIFRDRLFQGPLRVSGLDENGEVRMAEIIGHPFFMATLFLPQLSSTLLEPHPLIISFLKAAMAFHNLRNKGW